MFILAKSLSGYINVQGNYSLRNLFVDAKSVKFIESFHYWVKLYLLATTAEETENLGSLQGDLRKNLEILFKL